MTTTNDLILLNLHFPAQYLDVGEAVTLSLNMNTRDYCDYCGITLLERNRLDQTINGKQLQKTHEWILKICPTGITPITLFMTYFPVTSHGLLGMLAITAKTLGEALTGALNYYKLVMPAYDIYKHEVAEQTHIIFEAHYDFGMTNNFFTETVVTAFLQIRPFFTRSASQIPTIHFQHSPIGVYSDYEKFFSANFVFESQQNKIIFATQDLDIPLNTPSLTSNLMIKENLEQTSRQHQTSFLLTPIVKHFLKKAMFEKQNMDAATIAHLLALSTRTFSRRLQSEGYTFVELKTEVSCQHAKFLLLHTTKNIEQVAHIVGFGDKAAFSRAFKRLTGQTPSAFRGHKK